jgi:mono/diheme cytochrome c family protein
VLQRVFAGVELTQVEFVLRASDGYTVPLSGSRLLESGAYLAFADAAGPWEPIGAMKADPAPFYLVWRGEAQQDLATHPRPWSLASIAVEPFERVFPKVVPPAGAGAPVQRGFALFREQCVRCHAINQQGGRVGPELNVPRNITEYRDEAFLRAWLADPSSFRLSAMPAFAGLPREDVDALLAYLRAMAGAKVEVGPVAH